MKIIFCALKKGGGPEKENNIFICTQILKCIEFTTVWALTGKKQQENIETIINWNLISIMTNLSKNMEKGKKWNLQICPSLFFQIPIIISLHYFRVYTLTKVFFFCPLYFHDFGKARREIENFERCGKMIIRVFTSWQATAMYYHCHCLLQNYSRMLKKYFLSFWHLLN